jgi:toxin ParE1/3/4
VKLVIQPAARSDILKQMEYYADIGHADVAGRFLVNIRQSIEELSLSPNAGAPKYFARDELVGMRSWATKGFEDIRIYYLTDQDAVSIVRILHGRRDIESIFDDGEEAE